MTNILILTIVSTNWLPITVDKPGDFPFNRDFKEIGVIVSNRYAQTTVETVSNTFLISSDIHYPAQLLLRDKPLKPSFGCCMGYSY